MLFAAVDPIWIRCESCKKEFSFIGVLPRSKGVGFRCEVGEKKESDV